MARLRRALAPLAVLAAMVLFSSAADAATCYKYASKDDYPNCIQLDENLALYWRVINNETLELVPDGDGYMTWVALGISEAGMKGVDFSVAYVPTQGGAWLIGDFFTEDYSTPTYDQEQNVELLTQPAYDQDNHTMAVIQRPLDSCDSEDTPVYRNVERSLVWAYDWDTAWDAAKLKLGTFPGGVRSGVKLFTTSAVAAAAAAAAPGNASATTVPAAAADDDGDDDDDDDDDEYAVTMVVKMPDIVVPASLLSSAMCVNLALPNDRQYSVVGYQGFNTTPLVVRMLGYVCAPGAAAPSQAPGVPYECGNATGAMPALPAALPAGCETLNFMWVPGAGAFKAPPKAGFLIGAGAAATMVLQVFYWNLGAAVGQVDSSGFSLVYTPELRPNALGVLTVGNTDMRIPADNASYTALANICPAACTAKRVLAPVTLVSNFFVMRRMGKSILTRHIRNGSAIMPVGRINYWDGARQPGFQSVFPGSELLLPNDTLISVCTYNSSGTKTGTFYGTKNGTELCFNYITFYPVSAMPDLDYCIARTRDNVSSCGTRSRLTAMALAASNDTSWNGTRMQVGPLNISYYKSQQCQLHDAIDVTPKRKPNTRAAVASIVLVPVVLILVGVILYTKYSKEEELEALLAKARLEGIET